MCSDVENYTYSPIYNLTPNVERWGLLAQKNTRCYPGGELVILGDLTIIFEGFKFCDGLKGI
ncbi:MAG: hypothetical protein UW23_C0004G0011 [Candidatus Collierbacteria bacterium GW2011_GWA1_44_12]|uniref:Uncharacterized protein n=1 Tax=Candidatus Collierbacteria bacterium GW2011_GWA1_44_12 TaxID=1618376 RepID=A0A0G1GPG8_9BACT|nr:MAG: hypothetical protein UW23_C0004G0011 [Candidatus Collierbacteria bacterium GW2011_GWA1_44_12]